MYANYPDQTKIVPQNTGNGVEFNQVQDNHAVPMGVDAWLQQLGWGTPCNDPDTTEPLYQKSGNQDVGSKYFKWYEAIAWEWYMMMSLGGSDST